MGPMAKDMSPIPSPSQRQDKAAIRRQYKAQKQQYYRELQREEVHAMRKQLHELQDEVVRLSQKSQSKSLLPWKEVANALKEHAVDSVSQQIKLKEKRQKYIDLMLCLSKWIAQATQQPLSEYGTPLQTISASSWAPTHFSLARVNLVAHVEARRHGFDWLTQILYHNTDTLLQKYNFPQTHENTHRMADLMLDSANPDCINVVSRYVMEFPGPLEQVVDLVKQSEIQFKSYTGYTKEDLSMKRMTVDHTDLETLQQISPNMTYVFARNIGNAKGTAVLYREYTETDRVVVVGQSVPVDERFEQIHHIIPKKSMSWYVFDRVSPTRTLLRYMYVANHSVTASGDFVPFEDEAKRWGCDVTTVPEEAKISKLSYHLANIGNAGIGRTDMAMNKALRALENGLSHV